MKRLNESLRHWRLFKAMLIVAIAVLLAVSSSSIAQDWPMRGGNDLRNPVIAEATVPQDWNIAESDKPLSGLKWKAALGHVSMGDPVVSDGLVWVGTTNQHPRDPKQKGDAGVLMCFRERDGKFLWQYVAPRRKGGRTIDWPNNSMASSPHIDGEQMWFCSNRSEVVCLDIGPLVKETGKPREVWKFDMLEVLGIQPPSIEIGTRLNNCSPAAFGDFIYVNTGHSPLFGKMENPEAPSLICLEKSTGKLIWKNNSPSDRMICEQIGSPTVIDVDGIPLVVMGQADGWVRAFDAMTGNIVWEFDINKKERRLEFGNKYRFHAKLTQVVAEPVYANGRLFVIGGLERVYRPGTGRLCSIDPSGMGDVSSEIINEDESADGNPNSKLVWDYGSSKRDGVELTKEESAASLLSSISSVAVHKGLVIAVEIRGFVHCFDETTGEHYWSHDTSDEIHSSPLIVGERIYVGSGGTIFEIPLAKSLDPKSVVERETSSWTEASPVFANGTLYITECDTIWAIQLTE